MSDKLKQMKELKEKAKSGLLNAHRSGELESLSRQYEELETNETAVQMEQLKMEVQQEKLQESKDELMRQIRQKASKGLLNAKKTGELEELAKNMDEELARMAEKQEDLVKVKADLQETKKRAAAGMIRAFRDGELETIAQDLEDKQKALEMKKVQLAELKAKASKGIIDAKRSGHLNQLADEIDAMSREITEEKVELQTKAAREPMDGNTELERIRAKAKKNLLDAKRNGELQNIALSMAQMETLEAEIQETVADFSALKAKAKANLIGAYRTGELEKVQLEMEAKQKELEQKAAQFKELKKKARKNMIDGKRSGQLEVLATSMEGAHNEMITEIAVNVDLVQAEISAKQKASKALLKAHKSGELESIAADMERKLAEMKNHTEDGIFKGVSAEMPGAYALDKAVSDLKDDTEALQQKAKEYEQLKKKAKSALLGAHKSGELEQIANDMEAAQQEIAEKAARIKETKSKFSKNLIAAKRTGELEQVFNTFDETAQLADALAAETAAEVQQTNEAVGLTNFATRQKARASLLAAKRSGELELIAQDPIFGDPAPASHKKARRKKEPIDLQARNFNGVDIYSYFSDQDTLPRFQKDGAKRSVPSKLRSALLTAEEYPFLLSKRDPKSHGVKESSLTDFFQRNPGFKF
jgi:hypothetical protein